MPQTKKKTTTFAVVNPASISDTITPRILTVCQESGDELTQKHKAYNAALEHNRDEPELDIIEEMVASKWKQRRAWGIETGAYDMALEEHGQKISTAFSQADHFVQLAFVHKEMCKHERSLLHIQRADSQQSIIYHRALRDLIRLRDSRTKWEQAEKKSRAKIG